MEKLQVKAKILLYSNVFAIVVVADVSDVVGIVCSSSDLDVTRVSLSVCLPVGEVGSEFTKRKRKLAKNFGHEF